MKNKKIMCVQRNSNPRSSTILENAVSIKLSASDEMASETETKPTPSQTSLSPKSSLPISPKPSSSWSLKSKKKVKKSVQFDQSVTVRRTLHRKNYTSREADAAWYSSDEFDTIRRELLKTLMIMQSKGNHVHDFDDCESTSTELTVSTDSSNLTQSIQHHTHFIREQFTNNVSSSRGLENFNAKGSLKLCVKKIREKASNAILLEQDLQVEEAESLNMNYLYYDDEAIRDVYLKYSKAALKVAQKKGAADFEAASEVSSSPLNKSKPRRKLSLFSSTAAKDLRRRRSTSASTEILKEAKKQIDRKSVV